jgi:hypothetical protein
VRVDLFEISRRDAGVKLADTTGNPFITALPVTRFKTANHMLVDSRDVEVD